MKLPHGPIHKLIDTDKPARGINRICIAFRHARLWCYATDGRAGVRTAIDATSNELLELEALVGAGADKAGFLLDGKVFRELQKAGPFTIVKQEKQWLAKSISGSFYPIDLDLSPRVPSMFESLVAMEHDRVSLGRVGCNPDYLVKLRDSIGIEDDLLQFELSIDAGRPLVMRHAGNIAMLMPATGNEFGGIKALIDAAKEAVNIHPSRDRLAEMILKTFGVKHAEMAKVEDSPPGQ
jgi:hypothetical protein